MAVQKGCHHSSTLPTRAGRVLLHVLSTDRWLPASSVTHAAAALRRDTTPFALATWLYLAFFIIAQHSMTVQLIHCTMAGARIAIMCGSTGVQTAALIPGRLLGLKGEGCAMF